MSNKTLTELRIARACIKLLCIPERRSGASVSLARIGNCEICIFDGSQTNPDGMPLLWLELFDQGAKSSVDSFSCYGIEDVAVIFEDFVSQAVRLNQTPGPDAFDTQS